MSNNITVLSSPGFRFYPTEEELLTFYLHNKLENRREADMARVIPVADIYSVDPWQLPQMSGEPCIRDSEQWFFFCRRQEREAHGGRPTRTTPSGYWKATGSPTDVYSSASHRVVGVKKTMVFYTGRAPTGTKTKWKMNEYRATCDQDQHANTSDCGAPKLRNEFSLCRVYVKSSCLRSFDRRPPAAGAAAIASRRAAPEAESSGAKRARLHDGGSSSSSSAAGGDNGSSAPRGGAADDLKVLDEVDWEAFDWF